jgi:AcrR family transcriptional regulator
MPDTQSPTRKRIVDAATRLFYGEGIGRVSVDAVAEKAGLTKRTLYYHFRSKDDLVTAYLEEREQPNLKRMTGWFRDTEGGLAAKVEAIFTNLAREVRSSKWRGCAFLRTSAELVALPGHPAVKVTARHKADFESWLAGEVAARGVPDAAELARQVMLLINGAFALVLVHRDGAYMDAAGQAAVTLIKASAGKQA